MILVLLIRFLPQSTFALARLSHSRAVLRTTVVNYPGNISGKICEINSKITSAADGISDIQNSTAENFFILSCSKERLRENSSLIFPACDDRFFAISEAECSISRWNLCADDCISCAQISNSFTLWSRYSKILFGRQPRRCCLNLHQQLNL